jgi:hypothetical protein
VRVNAVPAARRRVRAALTASSAVNAARLVGERRRAASTGVFRRERCLAAPDSRGIDAPRGTPERQHRIEGSASPAATATSNACTDPGAE